MASNNNIVAAEVVKQLKEKKLIGTSENSIEKQIADGTIKEHDWKLFLQNGIKLNLKQEDHEAK